MINISIKPLAIPDIKVVTFGRFRDERGYFTEPYRQSDLERELFTRGERIVQTNESWSAPGVVRGLHFQWNPFMGKLVRTLRGHMVDVLVDIRLGSPTFGHGLMYDMPEDNKREYDEWIWVPPGFAHGNYFKKETLIEYYCTGEYNKECESGVSPLAPDINWSLTDKKLKNDFDELIKNGALVTEKDRKAMSIKAWQDDPGSKNFIYEDLK